jgi:alkanesulfonate monooxygenase SsuD/methylene tetrahydromethanopterin reductase-like flavin-dependent oxidoreductase (luciferase family)
MKFALFYELQLPKPLDQEQWGPDDERRIVHETLEQIELADRLGYDYVFFAEHHFLEEYCHSSAPEIVLAAAAARTRNIRLGHGIVQMPPRQNPPARVAERIATLDLVSNGRVEFGTGEGATHTEVEGFDTPYADKKEAWEEATRECLRMMALTPYPGFEGAYFRMPERNVIPKPLQRPHPPVWMATTRQESLMVAARLGIGAMGFGFETPAEVGDRIERYWELIRATKRPIGLAMNPAVATLGNMFCAPTNEEAIQKGLSGAQFFGFVFGWIHGHQHHGRDNVYREFRRRRDAASAEQQEAATALEPEEEGARILYRMGRQGLFMGSPEFIRANLRGFEAAHLDVALLFTQQGDRKHEDIMASLELFAREVMPEFKERHRLHQQWRQQQLRDVAFPVNSSI